MTEVVFTRVQETLRRLKLTRMAETLDGFAQEGARAQWSYLDFLDRLLEAEIAARSERDVAMKTKLARFPAVKTLEQFDFTAQPSINERQIRDLATVRFVAHGENILFLGPPGVGKTHLAIALGTAAIHQGISTYFLTVADLLDMLQRDVTEGRLTQRLQTLCKPRLLILDEMGYFPLDQLAARFLFQLVSRRYGRGSMVITSNKSYSEWGEVMADQVLAGAMLDRLLHVSTTVNIRGQSYRLREKRRAGVFHEVPAPVSNGDPVPSNG